jgi:hypothetical protein
LAFDSKFYLAIVSILAPVAGKVESRKRPDGSCTERGEIQ